MTITILGLGPGEPQKLTREAWAVLAEASMVIMWASDDISIAALPGSAEYHFLADDLDYGGSPGVMLNAIADAVVAVARESGDVVYAVPGDPHTLNSEANHLIKAAKLAHIPVKIVSGMSLLEPVLQAAGLEGAGGYQIHDALSLLDNYFPPFRPDAPVIVMMARSGQVVGRIKLLLLNQYQPEQEVMLVHHAGTDRQVVERLPLNSVDSSSAISHGTAIVIPPSHLPYSSFESLQDVMARLRSPEGCPWDREQTHESLRPYLLEEAYEVLDAIDQGDIQELREELGDLLLQVVFHTQVAVEAGEFQMAEVISYINTKLIRRHPHVWGDISVNGAEDVTRNWEAIKKQERQDNGSTKSSLLDGISKALPALVQAYNYQARAARVGFDWDRIEPVIEKIGEEISEIQAATDKVEQAKEIGDLLFALVNWIRWMGVEPETALREANLRFYRRFAYVEQAADENGRSLPDMTLQEMDALWEEAKKKGV